MYVSRSAGQRREEDIVGVGQRKRDDFITDCQLVGKEMVTFQITITEVMVIMILTRMVSRC